MRLPFRAALLLAVCIAPAASQAGVPAPRKVTVSSGTNMAAAISPDGKTVVFALQGRLWLMPATGGAAHPITELLQESQLPQWSPDGRTIVFQGYGDDWDIYTIRPDGSGLKRLTGSPYDEREPVFSPDGRSIAFSSDRGGSYDVWGMAADGGAAKRLTDGMSDNYMPTWAPDGKQIAFVSERDGAPALYAQDMAGSAAPRRLIAAPADPAASFSVISPAWSADGRAIAFVAGSRCRAARRSQCAAMTLKTLDLDTKTLSDRSDVREDVFPFRPGWSGGHLVYAADGKIRHAGGHDIPFEVTFDLERPAYQARTKLLEGDHERQVQGILRPQVSPDGTKVAFSALGDLWLASAEAGGGEAERVTDGPTLELDPTWSPDGRRLAYISDRGGKFELWVRDFRSGTDQRLASIVGDVNAPAWSPDGRSIAFLANKGHTAPFDLSVLDIASGAVRNLKSGPFESGWPTWLPDSRHISMSVMAISSHRFREGWNEDLIVGLDGTSKSIAPVSKASMDARSYGGPVWSPDGRWLAYIQDSSLWLLAIDAEGKPTGAPRQLSAALSHSPSWTADSKSLVLLSDDRLVRLPLEGTSVDLQPKLTWQATHPKGITTIWAGRLWDGEQAGYRQNVDIVIEGDVITAIRPHAGRPSTGRFIDASAETVVPGMIEAHAHLSNYEGSRAGRTWLSFGITTVREPGADPYAAVSRREMWGSGALPGPRIFTSGVIFDGTRPHYDSNHPSGSIALIDKEFARVDRLGLDFIKTYVRLSNPMQAEILKRAHDRGLALTSHELYPAVAIGVDAIEHLRGSARQGFSPKQSERGYSYDDVTSLLAGGGMVMTPTLAPGGGVTLMALKNPQLLESRQFRALYRPEERASLTRMLESLRPYRADIADNYAASAQTLRTLLAKGGRIAAGTDSPGAPPGWGYAIELQLYEAAGLTSEQVLRSATIWPAALLGVDDRLGSIKPGKKADLVIIEGDPLARIGDLMNVKGTMSGGLYRPLDELLNFNGITSP